MRHKVPEPRINKISQTIKSLKRKRPVERGTDTGKNLSLDMLYKNGTEGLNHRLFKNHASHFISPDRKRGKYLANNLLIDRATQELMEEYYEESYS